jgi:predicted transcriptional regulator
MNVIMLCFASSRGTMGKANHSAIQKGLTQTAVCIYLEKYKTEEKHKHHKMRVSFYHFLQNLFDALLQVRTSGRRTAFIIGARHGCQCPGILLV